MIVTYLRNTWYQAGWSAELKAGQLLHRRFLDEPVLLFRKTDGRSIDNPHGPVPSAARIKNFPVAERFCALWIWMGDPGKADPDSIVPFEFNTPEHWHVGTGHLVINANYELETDNILDLSHIEF